MLQNAYVNVAAASLRSSGHAVSAEAIAVMTEVSSSDAQELLSSTDDAKLAEAEQRMTSAAKVLLGWHTDQDYLGPYGLVRDIAFRGANARVKGFEELAKQYAPGFSATALLDELVRTGCVQDMGNGVYRALTRSYKPEQLSAESLRRFAKVVHNVIETLELNLWRAPPGGGRVESMVIADHGLTPTEFKAFDRYLRARGQLFLDDVDNWLSTNSREGQAGVIQTGIGLYHYVVNEQDERDFGKALQLEGDKNGD